MNTIFERVKHLNHLLSQQDRKPTVRIIPRAVQGTVSVTASKCGGVPYLPAGAQAPTNQDGTVLSYPKMSFTPRPGYFSSGWIRMMSWDWASI